MMKAAAPATGTEIEAALSARILSLSEGTMPETLPPVTAEESVEMGMRRKAEAAFQYALCQRTWWRLSTKERAQIRAMVLEEHPFYRDRAGGYGVEVACFEAVRRMLDEAREARIGG